MVLKEFDMYLGRFWVVRPRAARDDVGSHIASSWWAGQCMHFVSGFGCRLQYKQRPAQCRSLDPLLCPDQPGLSIKEEDEKLWKSWRAAQERVLEWVNNNQR
jgi:hypothetical protein